MTDAKHDEQFFEFKNKIQAHLKPNENFLHDDFYLKKWLVAREYNADKAEKMFLDNLAFREKYKVDEILENYKPTEILDKYTTGGIIGYDKEGNVLRIELFGKLDMKGIMYSSKKIDLEKMKILECENIVAKWKEWNDSQTDLKSGGLTVIFDMEGASSRIMWRPGLTMYLHLVKLLEDNYPEMLTRLLVINSPAIFPFIWSICKPLMTDRTKRKINILGSNYKTEILKYVDPSVLPKCYGGENTDPDGDPTCRSKICQGGLIPIELYSKEMENIKDAVTINIASGSSHFLKKTVEIQNSALRLDILQLSLNFDWILLSS